MSVVITNSQSPITNLNGWGESVPCPTMETKNFNGEYLSKYQSASSYLSLMNSGK